MKFATILNGLAVIAHTASAASAASAASSILAAPKLPDMSRGQNVTMTLWFPPEIADYHHDHTWPFDPVRAARDLTKAASASTDTQGPIRIVSSLDAFKKLKDCTDQCSICQYSCISTMILPIVGIVCAVLCAKGPCAGNC